MDTQNQRLSQYKKWRTGECPKGEIILCGPGAPPEGGSDEKQLRDPMACCCLTDGSVLVSDAGNNRVMRVRLKPAVPSFLQLQNGTRSFFEHKRASNSGGVW